MSDEMKRAHDPCTVTQPSGYICTRDNGHSGPCACYPIKICALCNKMIGMQNFSDRTYHDEPVCMNCVSNKSKWPLDCDFSFSFLTPGTESPMGDRYSDPLFQNTLNTYRSIEQQLSETFARKNAEIERLKIGIRDCLKRWRDSINDSRYWELFGPEDALQKKMRETLYRCITDFEAVFTPPPMPLSSQGWVRVGEITDKEAKVVPLSTVERIELASGEKDKRIRDLQKQVDILHKQLNDACNE